MQRLKEELVYGSMAAPGGGAVHILGVSGGGRANRLLHLLRVLHATEPELVRPPRPRARALSPY